MKFSIRKIEFEIPTPPPGELIFEKQTYVSVAYAPAKPGDIVYSIVKDEVLKRENASKSPYWILKRHLSDEENKKIQEAFDNIVMKINPRDIVEQIKEANENEDNLEDEEIENNGEE